jgi:DNA-binding NtrC family response regulator
MEAKKIVKTKPVVLSVEGDYFAQLLLRKTLKKHSFDTVLATNCAEGMSLLTEDRQISVCVLDLDFPNAELHEFFRHVSKIKKQENIRIIVTAENNGVPLSDICKDKHIDSKMIFGSYAKPIDFDALVTGLKELQPA